MHKHKSTGLDPTNKKFQIQFFFPDKFENFEPSNFIDKSEKIWIRSFGAASWPDF